MSSAPQEKPWYHEGLRFTCTGCGDCCTGAPGFVWVNKAEIQRLADLECDGDVEQFEKVFTRKVGIRKTLREFSNGDCVFLDSKTRACKVYEARPRQCRSWPFWDSNLRTPEQWERTCRDCPGAGQGELHSLEVIEQQRGEIRI